MPSSVRESASLPCHPFGSRIARWALAGWLSVLLVALGGCSKDEPTAPAAAATGMAVSVTPVVTRPLASGLTVSGPVSAVEEMQLGVEVSGLRVTALNVDVGQAVKRGQVLLTLDHRMLDSDLAQANAALREAEAGATLARSNLARGQSLAAGQYISANQLDELRAARTQAEARVGTARAARDAAALRRSFADLRAPATASCPSAWCSRARWWAPAASCMRLIRDGRLEWRAELPSRASWGASSPATARAHHCRRRSRRRHGPRGVARRGQPDPYRHRVRRPAAAGRPAARYVPAGPHRHGRQPGAGGADVRGGAARRVPGSVHGRQAEHRAPACGSNRAARTRASSKCARASSRATRWSHRARASWPTATRCGSSHPPPSPPPFPLPRRSQRRRAGAGIRQRQSGDRAVSGAATSRRGRSAARCRR